MLRDISLHIMDLAQNSVTAGVKNIDISVTADNGMLFVSIDDNGCGMSKSFLERVQDPFTTKRTTRKVGMGIPFFKLACEQAGGSIDIQSEENVGTNLKGSFVIDNIDRLPLGDLGETVQFLIMGQPDIEYRLTLSSDKQEAFVFDTAQIKEELEDVAITEHEILQWIREYINDNVLNIFGGVLDEIIGRA